MLETRSVVDAIRSEMQSQILRGLIPPGTTLAEVSVAQMFEVARPTAKAAIEQLVQTGLLRRVRHKAARVPLLNAVDVADLYLSRLVIEDVVVRQLAGRSYRPPGAALALDRMRAAVASGATIAELVESDIEFHRQLVAAMESPRLSRLHQLIIGETHLCMAQVQVHRLLDPHLIVGEHARVLDTIASGNVAMAASEIEFHISQARDRLVAYLQSHKNARPQ